jgi:hypothetical protein
MVMIRRQLDSELLRISGENGDQQRLPSTACRYTSPSVLLSVNRKLRHKNHRYFSDFLFFFL